MPIIIPDDKLLSRKEVAALLQISYDGVADRANGTDCLMEIRQTQKVMFNPHQVLAHREAVWTYGKCDGRCRAALQSKQQHVKDGALQLVKKKTG
jgi:hypothetical protein